MAIEQNRSLGQVFTSDMVANLMASMVKPYLTSKTVCLDPCIGKNVFFEYLSKNNLGKLVGIELDKALITPEIETFFKNSNRKLIIEDFFDFPLTEKFDIIIMNPPYIRQELLKSKGGMIESLGSNYPGIPKQANLYVYFLLKGLEHLKKNGKLIAITYDSWLFTRYGRVIKDINSKGYRIEKIVHFRQGAFNKINVGATVVLLSNDSLQGEIDYYSYNSPDELSNQRELSQAKMTKISIKDLFDSHRLNSTILDFASGIFVPLSSVSSPEPNRGIAPIANKYFILNGDKFHPYTVKIINDVSKLENFEVTDVDNYLLKLPKKIPNAIVANYIEIVKNEVEKNPDLHIDLYNRIRSKADWFSINDKYSGNVIFNYYFRKNTSFFYNPRKYLVSHNFYNLYITRNLFANFAILNSTITKFTLFKYGRSQGRGLFKIQLEQFKMLPILDCSILNKQTLLRLTQLGSKLISSIRRNSDQIIDEIDDILLKEIRAKTESKVTYNQIVNEILRLKGDLNE